MKQTTATHGTRGAVLGWLGRHEESVDLLKRAFANNPLRQNRALNACCLAISYAAIGPRSTALAWLDRARALDPSCGLRPRATAALNAEPAPAAALSDAA